MSALLVNSGISKMEDIYVGHFDSSCFGDTDEYSGGV